MLATEQQPFSALLRESLGANGEGLLRGFGRIAHDYGVRCYLVGGLVRDLLLGSSSSDVDVMVDSDLSGFLRYAVQNWQGVLPDFPAPQSPRLFKKFLTAKLTFHEELLPAISVVDFSQARTEVYPQPGDQPVVSPGSLTQDMERRDFSVNALAVSLAPESFGYLEDPTSGLADLAKGRLRLLHEQSLSDDPARIIRGVRLETRLSFCFEERTRTQIEEAIAKGNLRTLPPFRLFDETVKAFNDLDPWRFLLRAGTLGALGEMFPGSGLGEERIQRLHKLIGGNSDSSGESWEDLYALCYAGASLESLDTWLARCRVTGVVRERIVNSQQEVACRLNS